MADQANAVNVTPSNLDTANGAPAPQAVVTSGFVPVGEHPLDQYVQLLKFLRPFRTHEVYDPDSRVRVEVEYVAYLHYRHPELGAARAMFSLNMGNHGPAVQLTQGVRIVQENDKAGEKKTLLVVSSHTIPYRLYARVVDRLLEGLRIAAASGIRVGFETPEIARALGPQAARFVTQAPTSVDVEAAGVNV